MSFLSSNVIRQSLEEGKAYPAVCVSVTERESETNEAGILGYVVFSWLLDDGRVIIDSCRVTADGAPMPSGLKIRLSELADQLPKDSALVNVNGEAFANGIVLEKIKFNLWIDHNDTGDKFYTNYHFRAPRVKVPTVTEGVHVNLVAPTK